MVASQEIRDTVLPLRMMSRRVGLISCSPSNAIWGLLLSGALLGCSGDTTGPALIPAIQLYSALVLNQHAITLALTAALGQPVYDTVRLSATAFTSAGAQLPNGDSVVHYSDPDSSVTISTTGLVTAHYVTNSTRIIAKLTMGGLTHTDTAVIRVTQAPFSAPLTTLSIQPLPLDLDSAADALDDNGSSINNGQGNIPVYAITANGDSVCSADLPCELAVYFKSSNPYIATIDQNGVVTPVLPGHVQFIVSTLAYGVFRTDTLAYTIGYPTQYNIIQYYGSIEVGGQLWASPG